MKKLSFLLVAALSAALSQIVSAQTLQLQRLAGFGSNGDGSILPDERPYLTGNGSRHQRGMAYNPTTDHLLIVNRYPTGSESINIIDAMSGEDAGALDLSSLALVGSTSFPINLIGVAEDGAIYACNLTTSGTLVEFVLYRWENEAAEQTFVYFGDPRGGNTTAGNARWGDTLAVRGAGADTQVLIASRGTLAAILRPTDASMVQFTATTLDTDVRSGGLGYGLAFGEGNTFWGKAAAASGEPLYRLAFDLNAGTATTLRKYEVHEFPGRIGPVAVNTVQNLLAGIEMVPEADRVRLYAIDNPAERPVFLDRESYSTNVANNIFSGAAAFAPGRLYALNSDNGILAFELVLSNKLVAPTIFSSPTNRLAVVGSDVTLFAGADGVPEPSYQWFFNRTNAIPDATNSSLTISSVQLSDGGDYSFEASNSSGTVTSAVGTLTVLSTPTALLAYDPFSYDAGAALTSVSPWLLNSGTSGTIEAGNLSVPGLAPAQGNRFTWANSAMSVRLPLTTVVQGSLYFSFALRIEDVGTFTGSETIAGFTVGTGTAFAPKINIVRNDAGYQIGLYKAGGTTFGALDPTIFSTDDVVFVVARYTFNSGTGNDDTCDLWLNPDPSTFGSGAAPAATVAGIGTGATDLAQIDRFFLRAAGPASPVKKTVDEIRVGVSWAEVTPSLQVHPVLSIMRSAGTVMLSWPASGASGFVLHSIQELDDLDGWQPVEQAPVLDGDNYTVSLAITGQSKFFRLQK